MNGTQPTACKAATIPWWNVSTAIAAATKPRKARIGAVGMMILPKFWFCCTIWHRIGSSSTGVGCKGCACLAARPSARRRSGAAVASLRSARAACRAAAIGAQPVGADVGDAVALGVGAAAARLPGEVDAEAVGGGQAGALADQHGDRFGAHRLADVVAERDASLFGHDDRCNR